MVKTLKQIYIQMARLAIRDQKWILAQLGGNGFGPDLGSVADLGTITDSGAITDLGTITDRGTVSDLGTITDTVQTEEALAPSRSPQGFETLLRSSSARTDGSKLRSSSARTGGSQLGGNGLEPDLGTVTNLRTITDPVQTEEAPAPSRSPQGFETLLRSSSARTDGRRTKILNPLYLAILIEPYPDLQKSLVDNDSIQQALESLVPKIKPATKEALRIEWEQHHG